MRVALRPPPDVTRLRSPRHTADLLPIVGAAALSLLAAGALVKAPLIAIGAVAMLVLVVTLGLESLIALSLLGACGLLPFVRADTNLALHLKGYAIFFAIALGSMTLAYAVRGFAGRESRPLPRNALALGLAVLLAYVVLIALGSHPSEVPSLTMPFVILPLSGIAVIFWLSHDDALEGLRRVLPLVIAIVVAWALAYDAGAAGCGSCSHWVGTDVTNTGLLGPGSRLYTAGQNTLLGLFLIAFAYALHRPRPWTLALVGLGILTIALQASRAQYIGVAVGMSLLLLWKLSQLRVGGRIVLLTVVALALLALFSSPVGERAISTYTELQHGTGTGTYRLRLIHETSNAWTLFGQGFSERTLALGFDVDLGLPNTLLVLGYFGAVLQLALLGMGIWRGMAARTLAGTTVAAILLMVLVVRPSLPLLEYGHSAVFYGGVLGFAAVLRLSRRRPRAREALPR